MLSVWLGRSLRIRRRFSGYKGCPAGRARCARGGRLHAFLLLRLALPLVGMGRGDDEKTECWMGY
jgi:hypothetical protein